MFKFISNWFGNTRSESSSDFDLSEILPKSEPISVPNLKNHPVCPKYLSLSHQSVYSTDGSGEAGVFTVESSAVLDYLNNQKSRDRFASVFKEWLEAGDESLLEPYELTQNTKWTLKLEFFLDALIESDQEYSVFCPKCQQTYQPGAIEYQQTSGSWVTRHALCPNDHELLSLEVMHIMFKEGAKKAAFTRSVKPRTIE